MFILTLILFLTSSLSASLCKSVSGVRKLSLAFSVINAILLIAFFLDPLLNGNIVEISTWLRVDRFSAFIGVLITSLYLFGTAVSDRYIKEEAHEKILSLTQAKLYFALLPIFAMAMLLVVTADNLGLLWLALELTTLATTPLVAIYKKDGSLEAAWKYIILCSLGISLGLLGVLLVSYAGVESGLGSLESLSLKNLNVNANKLLPTVMQWAFLFSFVGLGTKVGFFPLHTWLPDAHGRTPSPISAILSGILLNVALYSLMRIKFITDTALASDQWTNQLFLIFGVLSVVASAFHLFIQQHYKRMLAYSSMEHMGILAIAIGLGPVGLVPALMHMFAHTFSKSLLFFGSGEILLHEKTAKIYNVRNLLAKIPLTGILFVLGMFALLAVPPFATFSSEILILAATVRSGHWVVCLILLLALTLVCVSLCKHTFTMLNLEEGTHTHDQQAEKNLKEKFNITHLIMIIQVIALVVAGIFMLTQNGYDFFNTIANSITS